MNDYPVRRCLHEGFTIVRLPADVDPRKSGWRDQIGLAFKRLRIRRWLRETIASRRNVIRFGSAAKS